jgi:hypothetical protein
MVKAMSRMRDGLPCLIHSFIDAHYVGKVPVIVGTFADCCSKEARPPASAVKSAIPGSQVGFGCGAGGGAAVVTWGCAAASAGKSIFATSVVVARGMAVTGRTGRLTGIGTL